MRIMAFRCDNCGAVGDSNSMSGLRILQPHLFRDQLDYEIEPKCEKAEMHFCMSCHNHCVVLPASSIKTNTDEGKEKYEFNFKALSRNFFQLVYRKYEANRCKETSKSERIMDSGKRATRSRNGK